NDAQIVLHVSTHRIGPSRLRGQSCRRGDDGGRTLLCQPVLGPAVAGLDAVRGAVELDRCRSPVGWCGGPRPGDGAGLGAVTEHGNLYLEDCSVPLYQPECGWSYRLAAPHHPGTAESRGSVCVCW